VLKYKINLSEETGITIPKGSEILHIGEQNDALFAWVLVSDRMAKADLFVPLAVHGTGHQIGEGTRDYIQTVRMKNGLVWHVFYRDGGK